MKLINILEAIANNHLKDKTRFKVCSSSNRQPFILELDNSYPGTLWCIDENDETFKFNYHIDFMKILNYEVTIIKGGFIEEDKKIEKLDIDKFTCVANLEVSGESANSFEYGLESEIEDIVSKINEIIDKVNNL